MTTSSRDADPFSGRTVCFFARVDSPEVLTRVEFYATDIDILRDLGFQVHIATTIRALHRADVIYVWWWTWALFPLLFAKLFRKPLIITGVIDEHYFRSRPLFHQMAMKLAMRFATANIFVSDMETKYFPAITQVRNPIYSPLVVDTATFTPAETEREDFIFTVAWLSGENFRRKGIPDIIRAAQMVNAVSPRTRFIIAGDRGANFDELEQLVAELELSNVVEFRGVISRAEKIALMQKCAIYLQPSRFEGFGVAILEAMSCGAPVIASPVGAVPEVVGEAGRFVPPGDTAAIATAVLELLQDESQRNWLSELARKRALELFRYERRRDDIGRIISRFLSQLRP